MNRDQNFRKGARIAPVELDCVILPQASGVVGAGQLGYSGVSGSSYTTAPAVALYKVALLFWLAERVPI